MLPSLRHYLRYIDIEKDFDAKGFTVKVLSRRVSTLFSWLMALSSQEQCLN